MNSYWQISSSNSSVATSVALTNGIYLGSMPALMEVVPTEFSRPESNQIPANFTGLGCYILQLQADSLCGTDSEGARNGEGRTNSKRKHLHQSRKGSRP